MKTQTASPIRIMALAVCLAACSVNHLWAGIQPQPFHDLVDQVRELGLDPRIESSLVTKVESALENNLADDILPAINDLETFNREVGSLRGEDISDRDADSLIADSHR